MSLIKIIRGFQVSVVDDGLLIEVNNNLTAKMISYKIELKGYPVSITNNGSNYFIKVWGNKLSDKFLLNGIAF